MKCHLSRNSILNCPASRSLSTGVVPTSSSSPPACWPGRRELQGWSGASLQFSNEGWQLKVWEMNLSVNGIIIIIIMNARIIGERLQYLVFCCGHCRLIIDLSFHPSITTKLQRHYSWRAEFFLMRLPLQPFKLLGKNPECSCHQLASPLPATVRHCASGTAGRISVLAGWQWQPGRFCLLFGCTHFWALANHHCTAMSFNCVLTSQW